MATEVYLPKTGDRVHVRGIWVTYGPKGWHEIHPAWKLVNETKNLVLHVKLTVI